MFGQKRVAISCPMCESDQKVALGNLPEFRATCTFCELAILVRLCPDGNAVAVDEKWEGESEKAQATIDTVSDAIHEIREALKSNPEDRRLIDKLEKLKARERRLEDVFDNKVDRYEQRQERWQAKRERSLQTATRQTAPRRKSRRRSSTPFFLRLLKKLVK